MGAVARDVGAQGAALVLVLSLDEAIAIACRLNRPNSCSESPAESAYTRDSFNFWSINRCWRLLRTVEVELRGETSLSSDLVDIAIIDDVMACLSSAM